MKAAWIPTILKTHWSDLARWVRDEDRLPEVMRGSRGSLSLDPLGCGNYGCVLRTGQQGLLLKATTDEAEARFVSMVLADPAAPPDGLIRYRAMASLSSLYKGRQVYLIWRDEAFDVGTTPSSRLLAQRDYDGQTARMFARRLVAFKSAAADARTRLSGAKSTTASLRLAEQRGDWARDFVYERFLDDGALGRGHYTEAMGRVSDLLQRYAGADRLALALELCRMQSEQMSQEPYGTEVGASLFEMLERGILLADVHTGNIGMAMVDGYSQPIPVITDPGHAVLLKDVPQPPPKPITDATGWPGHAAPRDNPRRRPQGRSTAPSGARRGRR